MNKKDTKSLLSEQTTKEVVSTLTEGRLEEANLSMGGLNFIVNTSADRTRVLIQFLPKTIEDKDWYEEDMARMDQEITNRLQSLLDLSVTKVTRTQMAGSVWSFDLSSLADKISRNL